MNLKSKFLVWYERLININYGKEFSENKINRFKQLSDIKYIENKFYDLKEKIGEEKFNHFVQCTILKEEDIENRIRGLEEKREMELEILKAEIKSLDTKLADPATYEELTKNPNFFNSDNNRIQLSVAVPIIPAISSLES